MISCRTAPVLLACLAVVACRHTEEKLPPQNPMGADAAGWQMGNPLLPGMGDPTAENYHVNTSEELEKIDNGAEGEIYWTDPDNPDKEIEGITAAFENKRNGNGWMSDYGRALRFAHRECRPLIIWFHDSVVSPKSGRLGEALLDTPAFNAWCKDRVVRVKLDAGASIDDRTRESAKYSRNAINRLALGYGLKKKPALAVIAPTGQFVVGIDGYSGFVEEVETVLKRGVEDSERMMAEHRTKLEAKGYRMWRSVTGISLFAKLQRYDAERRMVYLREYGGKVSRVRLKNFCAEDLEYLQAEQEKKGKSL